MLVSIRTSTRVELVTRPPPQAATQFAFPWCDSALERFPGSGFGNRQGGPLESTVDGLADEIGLRDAVSPGAFLEQTFLTGLDVDLLADHSRHPRSSVLHHSIHR